MATSPTRLPRRTQFLVAAIGAIIAAIFVVFALDASDQFVYTITRLTLSLIGFVACAAILFQSIGRVRTISNSPEQRLRMVTIVLLLAEIAALLAFGALITWNDPLPANQLSAIVGMMIRGSLAYGATVIAITRSDESETVTILPDEYDEFARWKRTIGNKLQISKAEWLMYQAWKADHSKQIEWP